MMRWNIASVICFDRNRGTDECSATIKPNPLALLPLTALVKPLSSIWFLVPPCILSMEVSFAPTVVLSHTPAPLSSFSTSFSFSSFFFSNEQSLLHLQISSTSATRKKKTKKTKKAFMITKVQKKKKKEKKHIDGLLHGNRF